MNPSRVWLLATGPLFVIGVLGITRLAMGLLRSTREAVVASVTSGLRSSPKAAPSCGSRRC